MIVTTHRNAGRVSQHRGDKRPRAGYCVVMDPEHFCALYREATA